MSTPKKEESSETSDPVFLNSGEVSQEVKEKKEPTMSDLFTLMGSMNTRLTGMENRMAVQEDRMAVLEARWSPKYSRGGTLEPNKEVLALPTAKPEEGARTSLFGDVEDSLAVLPQKTPLAVQEALMSPSRSRAPGQELKTAVSGVEVAKRTSSFEGSVSSEEERSQVETRSDDEDSQTLPTARIKLSPSLGHEIRVSHDEGDNLIVPDFLHEYPAKKPTVKDNPDRELAKEDASERASLFEDFVSGVLDRKEDMFSEKSFMVNLPKITSVASVPAHSLVVPPQPMTLEPEGGVDPALMKKPEPPDIKKVMERRLGQQETKSPPRRLVRRESVQGKWGERKR